MTSAYAFLFAAICSEVAATTFLKYSAGFTKPLASTAAVVGYMIAFALLAQTLKSVPVSIAYALWAALGTAAIATIGILFLNEPVGPFTVMGILLVMAGVVMLHLSTPA